MRTRAPGFTIVELVVVLLLLGVLSATALSRFVEPTAFAPGSISGAIKAQAHYAAQHAQAGSSTLALGISLAGNAWLIDVLDAGVSQRQSAVDAANTRVEVANDGNVFDVDGAAPLTLTFAGHGDLASGVVGAIPLDVNVGVEIRVVGDSTSTLCVYPTGYVSNAPC